MTTYLTSWEAKDANTLRRRLSRRGLGELGPVLKRQLGELDEQRHPLFQGKRLEPAGFLLFRFQASIVADERFHGRILPRAPPFGLFLEDILSSVAEVPLLGTRVREMLDALSPP
jgi:hypothetical protein